eukprot:3621933-Karenia_brevis.AAC.1
MSPASCNGRSCRRRLDIFGDHRASCPRSGRLKKRSRPLEKAVARMMREAGYRVVENQLLRETNLAPLPSSDRRQLEVVAYNGPLYHGQ